MRKKNKKIKMPNSYFALKDIRNIDFSPKIKGDSDSNIKVYSINDIIRKG